MANDKRFIVKNGLRSQNVEFTDSQDGSNQITLNMLNTDTLNFEGDAGSLFSISDDLTGTVFSVGDISGIPIIEVNGDTHNITFNEFDGKVMIGGTDSGSTDSDVLNVTGNVRATAYYGDGSNLTGIAASGGVDSTAVSSIITADVDQAFVNALEVDAGTLDDINSTSFLRSDAADAFSGVITGTAAIELNGGVTYDPSSTGAGTDTATDVGISLGSGQRIVGHNTGYIRTLLEWNSSSTIEIGQNNTALINHTKIYGGTSGGVELYEGATKRFETSASGATVTGTMSATTFSGSGASLTSLPAGQLTGTISDDRLPASISSDITGNAATATILSTARNIDITGVTASAQSFDGSGDIAIEVTAVPSSLLTGTISDARLPASISSDITGNAATATTATNITAVANNSTNETVYITFVDGATGTQGIETDTALSYNPSSNTLVAGVFSGSGASLSSLNASNLSSGTVSDARLPASISSDITGNAATATVLATARNIGGVSFNGAASISLPGVNITGNQDTSGNAATADSATSAGSAVQAENADRLDNISSGSFLRSDAADTKTSGDLHFSDNVKATFGDISSPDLEIFHDGTRSRITDAGTGSLRINTNNLEIRNGVDGEDIATFAQNGAVELYYDNSKKFETTNTGVTITGTATATAFSGDGSALTGIDAGSSVSVSLTAPGSPSEGDMWYDPEYGNLLVYYTDSDTSQWVTTNAPGVADNSINSSKFSNAVSLVIYDSSGSAVKTLFSPDN